MRRTRLSQSDVDLQIDPLVDVVFLLLFFFLFTFQVKQLEISWKLELARRGKQLTEQAPQTGVTHLHLYSASDGSLRSFKFGDVSGESQADLWDLILQQPTRAKSAIILWPDDDLHYEPLMLIASRLRDSGTDVRFGQPTN